MSQTVSAALVAALSLDPNRRPPSAAALRAALRPASTRPAGVAPAYTDTTIVATAPKTPAVAVVAASRRQPPWLWALSGALAAIVLAAGLAFAILPRQQAIVPQATEARALLLISPAAASPTAPLAPSAAP
ncbi:hypothetical protein HC891_06990, partial [Candidatus Gracilibacteria bacterium]|nr:hypothetical protein [Candidatus Gracilibacteria bacterium]